MSTARASRTAANLAPRCGASGPSSANRTSVWTIVVAATALGSRSTSAGWSLQGPPTRMASGSSRAAMEPMAAARADDPVPVTAVRGRPTVQGRADEVEIQGQAVGSAQPELDERLDQTHGPSLWHPRSAGGRSRRPDRGHRGRSAAGDDRATQTGPEEDVDEVVKARGRCPSHARPGPPSRRRCRRSGRARAPVAAAVRGRGRRPGRGSPAAAPAARSPGRPVRPR